MNDLKQQILALQNVSRHLEPNEEERQSLVNKVSRYASSFIDNLESTNAYSSQQNTANAMDLNMGNMTMDEVLRLYAREVADKGIKPASGGHIGYIPGGGIYTSAIADFLVDVTNEYVGMHYSCPAGTDIEHVLLDWMKSVFGFPKSAVGNLPSGGSIANLIALTAARDKHQVKNEHIQKSVVYMSRQVHHCVHKALRIIGLEDVVINYLDLDDRSRIKIDDLQQKIENDKASGLQPFLVIASAGTTDTGAIDPLKDIGDLALRHNLWYHVDAAYGGFFILVDGLKQKFEGIEMADSLVVDPHKGLFLPYGLGAVLIKDKEAVYHSHAIRANYMQDAVAEETPVNPADVSPELTKHFRSLRLWLPLQLHGLEPFVACLEEKILLTHYFRSRLVDLGFEVGPDPDLSVSYFWWPAKEDQNTFNEQLMKAIHKDGEVFLSSTILNGRYVIRIAILSFRTKLATIEKAIDMIERAKSKIENEK